MRFLSIEAYAASSSRLAHDRRAITQARGAVASRSDLGQAADALRHELGPATHDRRNPQYTARSVPLGEANMKRVLRIGMLLPILILAACATSNASRAPDANLGKLKTFYVVHHPEDGNGIEKLIAARLVTMGYQSTSGDAPKPAEPVDAVVTYQDRWMWDITMYMIKLDIQIHDGTSDAILAKGQVMRPSLERKSPEGMVEETLGVIFK
jgi:hypothetical protein